MKRIVLVAVVVAVLAVPAFAEFRIDLGAILPRGGAVIAGGDVVASTDVGDFLGANWLPFPEASFYYQWHLGPLNLAAGARLYTFILESVFWPNILAELQLGPVFIDGQVGGLLFGMFGLANGFEVGNVFVPDLSLWLGLGKKKAFRIGGGALGLYAPEVSGDGMLMVYYLGIKGVLNP